MTQLSILNGVFTDAGADWRAAYPKNLVPVPADTGISKGYLRTCDGMVEFASAAHADTFDRGSINWRGICYRVIGNFLCRVNADHTVDDLGTIPEDNKRCTLVNSFDRLAIAAAGKLFYWDEATGVTQVTDPDLGLVLDVIWIAGYFMTTDGESLVVTDLDDPYSVNPLKYGSSEASPDAVNSLLSVRNEAVAVNRNTCETFQNIGGAGFPFQRIEGAMIPRGSIGTHATSYYLDEFAFVGSGANESLSVFIGSSGQTVKIATREIETILLGYTEEQLAAIIVESRVDRVHQFLYIHLPDQSLVYDAAGSQALGEPVWFTVASGADASMAYRARNYCFCYGKWLFGDLQSQKVGYFSTGDARQFGDTVPWQFDTQFLYNAGKGVIIHDLELVRLSGRQAVNPLIPGDVMTPASIFMSWSDDGLTYSDPKSSPLTTPGQTGKRTQWRGIGSMENFRSFRFRGMNNPYPDSFARLEATLEPLFA